MKKKGFTLIELLAVIVILGIITVIAVPKVLDIINKSRESAASSSIKLVKDAIKTQVASSDLTGPVFTKETDGCYIFNFDDQTTGNAKILEIRNKDKVSGSIKYCNNTFSDDTLKFDGNSISKDEPKDKIICKRATTLHTEECTQNASIYYCSGAGLSGKTITYGNLGTTGTLTSGDAFDCDVNGDGVYDPNTERFYYVSDYYNTSIKSFEDDTAVLVYYNNVSAGSPSTNSTYAYDSSGENFYGPRTAITELPTTSQWSNVNLKSTTRTILNENESNTTTGGILPSNFSYAGYSARLLTIQEVRKSTNNTNVPTLQVGELDVCNYLMENTKYSNPTIENWGYWIEEVDSSNSTNAWAVYGSTRRVANDIVLPKENPIGIRPAIEVLKKNIEY